MTQNYGEACCNSPGDVNGIIFGIQHFAIHDGPGIRSTVFLKGCPLDCMWCHNPEGIDRRPVLAFFVNRCIGCGNCFRICPDVHKMVDGKHIIDRDMCNACGKCVKECYGKALEIVGKEISAKEVIQDLLRDRIYYENSNGGITLSGGEPLTQFQFTYSLLKLAKAEGLHCALETNGFNNYDLYEQLLPMVDLFLYDYKESSPEKHKEYTGVENKIILENLRKLNTAGARIILRCPIIPGLNDREDHFAAIAHLTKELESLDGAELLFYHKLGVSKAERMGLAPQKQYEQPDSHTKEQWKNLVLQYGGRLINS